jgi:hypothetical protein
MAFPLLSSYRGFGAGSKTFQIDADWEIGGQFLHAPGAEGFFDLTAANSADFAGIVNLLTNGVDDDICVGDLGITEAHAINAGVVACGLESDALDGIHGGPDMRGSSIDFVRLLIGKVNITYREVYPGLVDQMLDSEVVWQFWEGQPLMNGNGHPSEVDDFLAYANPLQSVTELPTGTSTFAVRVLYGPTIDAASFRADVNGAPFEGFTPIAGSSESVVIPLGPGRNVLRLSVDGSREDARTATDRDQLTFVVWE